MSHPKSLRSAIFSHDNDYGFHPCDESLKPARLSVSCIVPYYETGPLARLCLGQISRALAHYRAQFPGHHLKTQILVMDDGSTARPFAELVDDLDAQVTLIRSAKNRGRSATRNEGLARSAGFDIALFVDSDVLIADGHVSRICELCSSSEGGASFTERIVASFFATLRKPLTQAEIPAALSQASARMDWRWRCVFQPTWLGTESDWIYVGRQFALVEETNYFRSWRGMVGPWSLPNMVLGGCFAVPVGPSLRVGGFDESFDRYGFTETTLVAKLIGAGVSVIPQLKAAALHAEWNPNHQHQADRNIHFRKAHRQFYCDYLRRPHDSTN